MNWPISFPKSLRKRARYALIITQRLIATAGLVQSESRIARDSQAYWRSPDSGWWACDSHWRDAPVFADGDLWDRIGKRHVAMLEAVSEAADTGAGWGRMVEWGCGGGANAVQFAPRCAEFIGVDVAPDSLEECRRQVGAVCGTPFQPVLIDVDEPEQALSVIEEPCDVFLSFYVFELLPTPQYGQRILRIAEQLLTPGGHALIQVKYDDGTWRTRSRRRNYRFGVGSMTTYPIAAFWEMAAGCGLEPRSVHLRPHDELDQRYAYFHLRKPIDRGRADPDGSTVVDRLTSIGLSRELIETSLAAGRVEVDGKTVTDPHQPAAPPAWIAAKDL